MGSVPGHACPLLPEWKSGDPSPCPCTSPPHTGTCVCGRAGSGLSSTLPACLGAAPSVPSGPRSAPNLWPPGTTSAPLCPTKGPWETGQSGARAVQSSHHSCVREPGPCRSSSGTQTPPHFRTPTPLPASSPTPLGPGRPPQTQPLGERGREAQGRAEAPRQRALPPAAAVTDVGARSSRHWRSGSSGGEEAKSASGQVRLSEPHWGACGLFQLLATPSPPPTPRCIALPASAVTWLPCGAGHTEAGASQLRSSLSHLQSHLFAPQGASASSRVRAIAWGQSSGAPTTAASA